MTWQPRPKTAEALDKAFELVNSVSYAVSARWLFYRLLQLGYYSKKNDYKGKFLPAVSRARHEYYQGWRPDTLADDTRDGILRGGGFRNSSDWFKRVIERLDCPLNKWVNDYVEQEYFVELWFEARAMAAQFKYYSSYINLRPMGGQPSIPFKYEIAQYLGAMERAYDLPIVILYFGDLDPAGDTISDTVERDVRKWCAADFKFISCGLTMEQVYQWDVPERPEKPGEYQWEALSDEGAEDIITTAVAEYVDLDLQKRVVEAQKLATDQLKKTLKPVLKDWEQPEGDLLAEDS